MQNTMTYSLLMPIAGIGIPVMATLNSGLGVKLGSSALATSVLFLVGFLVSFVYLLKSGGVPGNLFRTNIPWYFYLGGFLVAFYILCVTWVSPRFGIGNAVSFVLLGQLIAISIIDHFGILGARQSTMDVSRAIGLTLMVVGVFMVIKRN